jgi:phage-related protein
MTVSYTFIPPFNPDFGTERKKKPRVLKAEFGDGYAQRAGDGLNNRPVTLNLAWTNLTTSEKNDIIDFFEARKGYQSFYYTYQDENSPKIYVCEEWSHTHTDATNYTITATLQQVYDVGGASDVYFSDVVFLSGFEGGSVTDESPLASAVTLSGSTVQSSAQAKFGSKSLLHPTGGGMASVPDNAAFFFGTAHFTVELFVRFISLPAGENVLMAQWDETTGHAWKLTLNSGVLSMIVSSASGGAGSSVVGGGWVPSTGVWHHVAVDFDGTTYRLYVNGTRLYSGTSFVSIHGAAAKLSIGALTNSGAAYHDATDAYFDEMRVTASVARYADDDGFVVPTEAYPRV